jgi:glycine/D-amino acid oxidase-like deaminating enzyme
MLAPGGELEADSALSRMALRSLSIYAAFVDELASESGVAIDYRNCGAIDLAATDEKAERQAEAGIRSERCEYRGYPARFYPDDAVVDPREVTQALLTACRARGVAIHENEAVLKIGPAGGRAGSSVTTAVGAYQDDGVLVAAGAWSSDLYPGLPKTTPVRGHLVAYRMPPGLLASIVRNHGTYLVQRSSGIVIAGTSTEHAGFDRSLDEAVIADIARRAGEMAPELRGVEMVERWNGFRPAIAADAPFIGRVAEGPVYAAIGHYRNGILLAPETARLIANLVAA